MKRAIGLVIVVTLAVACGSDGTTASAPVAVPTSATPDIGADGHRRPPCDVRLEGIVPAMLTGIDPAEGSWHLAAHAEIASSGCRSGEPRKG